MADHSAIVELGIKLRDMKDEAFFDQARAAYAAVLRDLMQPSDPLDKLWLSNNPDFLTYLQARAIEIGVEI